MAGNHGVVINMQLDISESIIILYTLIVSDSVPECVIVKLKLCHETRAYQNSNPTPILDNKAYGSLNLVYFKAKLSIARLLS